MGLHLGKYASSVRTEVREGYVLSYFLREINKDYYERRNECENGKTLDGESRIRYGSARELTRYLREG